MAIERMYLGEEGVFAGIFRAPEQQTLSQLQEAVAVKNETLEKVGFYRMALRFSKVPAPLRRLLWWGTLNMSGLKRSKRFGTFGLSSYGALGAEQIHPISPLSTTLTYGPIDPVTGRVIVKLIYDHRVLDGAYVARRLRDVEEVLNGPILAELREGLSASGSRGKRHAPADCRGDGPGRRERLQQSDRPRDPWARRSRDGWVVLTGGRDAGVMRAVNEGAKAVEGSLTVGILPSASAAIARCVDIAIITEMHNARNNINVLSSRVVIAFAGGGPGTVSEIALALKAGKHVILMGADDVARAFYKRIGRARVTFVTNAEEAVQAARPFLNLAALPGVASASSDFIHVTVSPASWSVVIRTSRRLITFLRASSFEVMNSTLSSTRAFDTLGTCKTSLPEPSMIHSSTSGISLSNFRFMVGYAQVGKRSMVVQDFIGEHLPVVEPARDVDDREDDEQRHEDHQVEAAVRDRINARKDCVNRLEQVELEIRTDPENNKQEKEDRQDPRDQGESRKVESHHQQVEGKHAEEEHCEQVLGRFEPIDLMLLGWKSNRFDGNLFVRRLEMSDLIRRGAGLFDHFLLICQGSDGVLQRPRRVMSTIVVYPHPGPANQSHDGRGIEEDHLRPNEDLHPLFAMHNRRRGKFMRW